MLLKYNIALLLPYKGQFKKCIKFYKKILIPKDRLPFHSEFMDPTLKRLNVLSRRNMTNGLVFNNLCFLDHHAHFIFLFSANNNIFYLSNDIMQLLKY